MKSIQLRNVALMALVVVVASSCKLADMRTEALLNEGVTAESEAKGRALLQEVVNASGWEARHQTYEVVAQDHWAGMLGKMGTLWPETKAQLKLKYLRGTFDSQVEFLAGKRKGEVAGLQSWNYYEMASPGAKPVFMEKGNERITFGLAAFQYFFELPERLLQVPIVSYAGQTVLEGTTYDLVFATWGSVAPNAEYDQYKLYINPSTKRIDFASYSIRENYMAVPAGMYGTIRFADYRQVDGVWISHLQEVYLNEPAALGEYAHQLLVKEVQFNTVTASSLQPSQAIEALGDAKASGE